MTCAAAAAAARATSSAPSRKAGVNIVYFVASFRGASCSLHRQRQLPALDLQVARTVGLRLADVLQRLGQLRIVAARSQAHACMVAEQVRRERAGRGERPAEILDLAGDA